MTDEEDAEDPDSDEWSESVWDAVNWDVCPDCCGLFNTAELYHCPRCHLDFCYHCMDGEFCKIAWMCIRLAEQFDSDSICINHKISKNIHYIYS